MGSLAVVAVTASRGVHPQPCLWSRPRPHKGGRWAQPCFPVLCRQRRAPASHGRRLARDGAASRAPADTGSLLPSPSEGGRRCLCFEILEGNPPSPGETWTGHHLSQERAGRSSFSSCRGALLLSTPEDTVPSTAHSRTSPVYSPRQESGQRGWVAGFLVAHCFVFPTASRGNRRVCRKWGTGNLSGYAALPLASSLSSRNWHVRHTHGITDS